MSEAIGVPLRRTADRVSIPGCGDPPSAIHNIPSGTARALPGHPITEAIDRAVEAAIPGSYTT